MEWLDESEKTLDSEVEIANDPDKIKTQLALHKVTEQRLIALHRGNDESFIYILYIYLTETTFLLYNMETSVFKTWCVWVLETDASNNKRHLWKLQYEWNTLAVPLLAWRTSQPYRVVTAVLRADTVLILS